MKFIILIMPKNKQPFIESNLVKFLKLLSKDEMKEFSKFVQSPFHNNRSEVMVFFNEIRQFHPAFNQKNFSKEIIYSKLYSKKKYDDDVMRRLSSNLFKLGEEFISYKRFRDNEFNYEKNLVDFYSTGNDDKFFWKQFEKINGLMQLNNERSAEYFHRLSLINEKELFYMLKDDPNYKRSGYEKQLINLWKYFFIELLKLNCNSMIETKFFNKNYEIPFVKMLLEMAEDSNFMNETAIEIYYYLLKLQTGARNDETFYKAKDLVDNNPDIFDKHECFLIYTIIISYCSDRKVDPKNDFTRVEFEIAQKMVEKGLVTAAGTIDPGWFLGIFFRALNAKEINFAEKFIEDHKDKLTVKDKENIINHAYASLAMSKKEYEKALHYLSMASYKSLNDKLTANVMQLQIYYDADMHEQFFYSVDRFKHILTEEEHADKELLIIFKNFVSYSTKIYRMKLGEINIPHDELKQEIKNSRIIARGWLLEKVIELKK